MGEEDDLPEWQVIPILISYVTHTDPRISVTSEIYPQVSIVVVLRRNSMAFVWNIMFVLFSIVMTVWVTFGYPHNALQDRMNVNMAVMLTAIFFRLTINVTKPHLSCITWLDLYIHLSFLFLVLNIILNVIVYKLPNKAVAKKWDRYCFFASLSAWIAYHIYIIQHIFIAQLNSAKLSKAIKNFHHGRMPSQHKLLNTVDDTEDWTSGEALSIVNFIEKFIDATEEWPSRVYR